MLPRDSSFYCKKLASLMSLHASSVVRSRYQVICDVRLSNFFRWNADILLTSFFFLLFKSSSSQAGSWEAYLEWAFFLFCGISARVFLILLTQEERSFWLDLQGCGLFWLFFLDCDLEIVLPAWFLSECSFKLQYLPLSSMFQICRRLFQSLSLSSWESWISLALARDCCLGSWGRTARLTSVSILQGLGLAVALAGVFSSIFLSSCLSLVWNLMRYFSPNLYLSLLMSSSRANKVCSSLKFQFQTFSASLSQFLALSSISRMILARKLTEPMYSLLSSLFSQSSSFLTASLSSLSSSSQICLQCMGPSMLSLASLIFISLTLFWHMQQLSLKHLCGSRAERKSLVFLKSQMEQESNQQRRWLKRYLVDLNTLWVCSATSLGSRQVEGFLEQSRQMKSSWSQQLKVCSSRALSCSSLGTARVNAALFLASSWQTSLILP